MGYLDDHGLERFYSNQYNENVHGDSNIFVLSATAWIDNQQTIESEFIKSDDRFSYIPSYAFDSRSEYIRCQITMKEPTSDGTAVFHTEELPTKDIVVYILRLEV